MGVRDKYTKYEQNTQQWRSGMGVARHLGLKIRQKWPKIAIFGADWVPRMSMEGSNCIGTNLDDRQTALITVVCFAIDYWA